MKRLIVLFGLLSTCFSFVYTQETMENAPPPVPFGELPQTSPDNEKLPENSPYSSLNELPPY